MGESYGIRQRVGFFIGLGLFLTLLVAPVPSGMQPAAMNVAAIAALMAAWWISEAIPIPATALLPVALYPLLGVMDVPAVANSYSHHLIFLLLGGFFIAVTMERWNLHRRIALRTILLVGLTPQRIVLGFMLATAFLSMWISNTATTMMMATIGLAVIRQVEMEMRTRNITPSGDHLRFSTSLMLGIAYSASIGGVATLVGTPTNAVLAGVVESNFGFSIDFAHWMAFGLPLSAVMLVITWLYLTRIAFPGEVTEIPGGRVTIHAELEELGATTRQEWRVLMVFTTVAAAWILRGVLDIPILEAVKDSTIAIAGALVLFLMPSGRRPGEFLLDWSTAVRIPWDVIILFGGGFALARGFSTSGLTEWIAQQLTLMTGLDIVVILLVIVLMVVFLTEVTSNVATASLVLPIMGALAVGMSLPPVAFMVPAAVAASFAFMLPVATPPNAIVYGTRQVSIPEMMRAGIWLNLVGAVLITAMVWWLLPVVWRVTW